MSHTDFCLVLISVTLNGVRPLFYVILLNSARLEAILAYVPVVEDRPIKSAFKMSKESSF